MSNYSFTTTDEDDDIEEWLESMGRGRSEEIRTALRKHMYSKQGETAEELAEVRERLAEINEEIEELEDEREDLKKREAELEDELEAIDQNDGVEDIINAVDELVTVRPDFRRKRAEKLDAPTEEVCKVLDEVDIHFWDDRTERITEVEMERVETLLADGGWTIDEYENGDDEIANDLSGLTETERKEIRAVLTDDE